MNREERRRFAKNTGTKVSKEAAEAYNTMQDLLSGTPQESRLSEGDRVMINVDGIIRRKDWAGLNSEYKEFVESSRGEIFTVHFEGKGLVSLIENPRWLFFSEGDSLLRIVETGGNNG